MSTRVWLSYALNFKGDYENLYIWLDTYSAKECGDSMATFFWETENIAQIKQEIIASLKEKVTFEKKDRVYLVFKKPDSTYMGSFIIGNRKASPWEGLSKESNNDDEE